MKRIEFTARVKMQGFERCCRDGKPYCEACGRQIIGVCEFDHRQPLGLGGASTLKNLQVLCGACHRAKTHGEDRPVMAKADRQKKSRAGIKRKWTWPKRKFNTGADT